MCVVHPCAASSCHTVCDAICYTMCDSCVDGHSGVHVAAAASPHTSKCDPDQAWWREPTITMYTSSRFCEQSLTPAFVWYPMCHASSRLSFLKVTAMIAVPKYKSAAVPWQQGTLLVSVGHQWSWHCWSSDGVCVQVVVREAGGHDLRLNTKLLERYPGAMMFDREAVQATAERMAEGWRRFKAEASACTCAPVVGRFIEHHELSKEEKRWRRERGVVVRGIKGEKG